MAGRLWAGLSAKSDVWSRMVGNGMRANGNAALIGAGVGAGYAAFSRDGVRDKLTGIPIYAAGGAALGILAPEIAHRLSLAATDASRLKDYLDKPAEHWKNTAPDELAAEAEKLPEHLRDYARRGANIEGLTNPISRFNQSARVTVAEHRLRTVEAINDALGVGGKDPTRISVMGSTPEDLAAVYGDKPPDWLRMAFERARKASTSERSAKSFLDAGVENGRARDLEAWTWEKMRAALDEVPEDTRGKAWFSELHSAVSHFSKYSKSFEGAIGVDSMINVAKTAGPIELTNREDVLRYLDDSEHGRAIGEQINKLGAEWRVAGEADENGVLTRLKIRHESMSRNDSRALDIHVGDAQAIIHGETQSRTIRNVFLTQDLAEADAAMKRGEEPVAEAVRGDVWGVKQLVSVQGRFSEDDDKVNLLGEIQKGYERAITASDDDGNYHFDTDSFETTQAMHDIRRNQAVFWMPEDDRIADELGLGRKAGLVDDQGRLTDRFFEVTRQLGYGQISNEGSARHMIMDFLSGYFRMSHAAILGTEGKSSNVARDQAKGFRWASRRGALGGHRLLGGTNVEAGWAARGDSSIATKYVGVMNEELEVFRELGQYHKLRSNGTYKATIPGLTEDVKQTYEMLEDFAKRNHVKMETMLENLGVVGRVHEGVNVLALHGDITQVTKKIYTVGVLNPELFKDSGLSAEEQKDANKVKEYLARRLELAREGKVARFDKNVALGVDAYGGRAVTSTYAGTAHGKGYNIVGVRFENGKAVLEVEEHYSGRHAKTATHFTKSESEGITERAGMLVHNFLGLMRRSHERLGGIYAHQGMFSYLTPRTNARDGLTIAFVQAETFPKVQGANAVMLDTLVGAVLPSLKKEHQDRLVSTFNHALRDFGGRIDIGEMGPTKRRIFSWLRNTDLTGPGGKKLTARQLSEVGDKLDDSVAATIFHTLQNPFLFEGVGADVTPMEYLRSKMRIKTDDPAMNILFDALESKTKWGDLEKHFGERVKALYKPGEKIPTVTRFMRAALYNLLPSYDLVTQTWTWGNRELNIPGQAGITLPELIQMRAKGHTKTFEEMLSRRVVPGNDDEMTTNAISILSEMHQRGLASNSSAPTALDAKLRVFSLAQTNDIAGGNDTIPHMRGLKQYEDNFVIDLRTADRTKQIAEDHLRKAMGLEHLQVFVPGTESAFWDKAYVSPKAGMTSGELHLVHLRNLRSAVEKWYETEDKKYLDTAVKEHALYYAALKTRHGAIEAGRDALVRDSGANMAGIVQYRSYTHDAAMKEAFGELGSSRVTGLSEEGWNRMAKDAVEDALRRGEYKTKEEALAAIVQERNGIKFLTGYHVRYPASSVDTAFFVADKTIRDKGGIAIDETFRWQKMLDWDGDTLYAHVLTRAGSIAEHCTAMFNKNADSSYKEFMRVATVMGGFEEEHKARIEKGLSADVFVGNVKKLVASRFGNIVDASATEMASKYFTSYIGVYSNLSRSLFLISSTIEGQTTRQAHMRGILAQLLEQRSIDFGRNVGAIVEDKVHPSDMASALSSIMHYVVENDSPEAVETANDQLHKLIQSAGLDVAQREKFEVLRKAAGGNADELERLAAEEKDYEYTIKNFFTGLNHEKAQTVWNAFKEVQDKGLNLAGKKAADILAAVEKHWRNIQKAAPDALLPVQGRTAAVAMLTEENSWIKEVAAGSARAFRERFRGIMKTDEGRAAGVLGGIALAGAAAIGLLMPAQRLSEPGGAAARISRTPDAALVGVDGRAPIPGNGGGNVEREEGPYDVAEPPRPVMIPSRRFYYQHTNSAPRLRVRSSGDQRAVADAIGASRVATGGGPAQINMTTNPRARRRSDVELHDRLHDMTR
ncbi:MAG: hypothetical protein ABFD84_13150 [Candidatus Polarisedimenticolia bacterium]